MKKILNILLLNNVISVSCLPIIGCNQEVKVHNPMSSRGYNREIEL